MFKIYNCLSKKCFLNAVIRNNHLIPNVRTFLSPAYYCEEVWEHRLNNPILQKINFEELYYELDNRFQKTRQMSAVDVDIFVNATTNDVYIEENLDLVHKLRLSADTGNMLNSTSHALIRTLTKSGKKEDLLNALDDRLNYGLFLDFYTANLLLDTYWKNKDFTSGTRVASQLMLQEEFNHPLSLNLSLLHCYNYLLQPENWPEYPKPEEPEEEVKIRVKYLRNPYDDDHFDLREPKKIVGKTLEMFTKRKSDPLSKSLNILGLALYNKQNLLSNAVDECVNNGVTLFKEIVDLIPQEYKEHTEKLKTESVDVQRMLINNVEKAVQEVCENDTAEQCKVYLKWETDRMNALEEQKMRLLTAKRLEDIENIKAALKEKETKLWFFENEEEIERAIEAKKVQTKKTAKQIEEDYVPPEVQFSQKSNKT